MCVSVVYVFMRGREEIGRESGRERRRGRKRGREKESKIDAGYLPRSLLTQCLLVELGAQTIVDRVDRLAGIGSGI